MNTIHPSHFGAQTWFAPTDQLLPNSEAHCALARNAGRRILRDVISAELDGRSIDGRDLVRRLRLDYKRPSIVHSVIGLAMRSLRERGIGAHIRVVMHV